MIKPVPAKSLGYDLDRLAQLRDRHRQLLEDYRRASAAVQEAAKALARLRMEYATHPAAAEVLRNSSEHLRKFTVEQLTELQISPRAVQLIQVAENRLSRLTAARDLLRGDVTRSTQFTTQLEAFAKARNL